MTRTLCSTLLLAALALLAGCDFFASADQRVARAERQMSAHDYRAAIIELKNALQDEPDHVRARARLAEAEFRVGDLFAAEKDLKRAIELGDRSAEGRDLMAQIDLALGRPGELLARIDAGEAVPEGAARSIYRGRALLALQRFAEAQREFAAVPAADPLAARATLGLAEALGAQGHGAEAVARLDALIAAQPEFAPALLTRGVLQARRGEFARAETDFLQAREAGADNFGPHEYLRLLMVLTETQLALGKVDEAAGTHAELAKLAPEGVGIRVLAARIALARQNYPEAVNQLQKALAIAPGATNARFLLGAALFAQGSAWQAERQLQQVLEGSPENLEARKLLAQIHLVQGRPDAAMQVLLPAQDADDAGLEMLRGLARLQQGEEAAGMAELERAVAAHPEDNRLRVELASAYVRSQRAEQAVELLSKSSGPGSLRQSGVLIAALSASGDLRRAQAEVERLVAAHPNEPVALGLAADFFARQRAFDRARALTDRALRVDPRNVTVMLSRAAIESQAGENDAARQWLERVVAADASNEPAMLALAELALRRGDSAAAVSGLEKLRAANAGASEARLRLARLYLGQRNNEAARGVLAELNSLGKERPDVLNSLGLLYLDAGRYDDARAQFQAAAQLDGANPVYWLNTARAQLSLGSGAEARQALERALGAQPGWIPAVGALAMLDVKEGRVPAALERVAELKRSRPRDALTLSLEGDVLMAASQFAKAAPVYDAAYAMRPSAALALRAYSARQRAGLPGATAPLENWLKGHPDDHGVQLVMAEADRQAGNRAGAVARYERILGGGEPNPIVLNNLAWLYYETGDARAAATARRALELAPRSAPIADTYGWILLNSGKATEALPLLQQAASELDDPTTEYHYAVALARTGAPAEAQRRLVELLKKSPVFPEAAEAQKLVSGLQSR